MRIEDFPDSFKITSAWSFDNFHDLVFLCAYKGHIYGFYRTHKLQKWCFCQENIGLVLYLAQHSRVLYTLRISRLTCFQLEQYIFRHNSRTLIEETKVFKSSHASMLINSCHHDIAETDISSWAFIGSYLQYQKSRIQEAWNRPSFY